MTVQELIDSLTEYLSHAPEAASDTVILVRSNGDLEGMLGGADYAYHYADTPALALIASDEEVAL